MSDTTETSEADAKLQAAKVKLQALIPPGFEMKPSNDTGCAEGYALTWLDGETARTANVGILGLGAQFDLAELTGVVDAQNDSWQNMAYVAASVKMLDGVPPAPVKTKHDLRRTLDKLGMNGFRAVSLVVNGYRGAPVPDAAAAPNAGEIQAVVKN